MERKYVLAVCLLYVIFLLPGCAAADGGENGGVLVSSSETYETSGDDAGDYKAEDNKALYSGEDDSVITMYLTVGRGNDGEDTDHTWKEVNGYPLGYYEEKDIKPYKCEAVLQVGDENGPQVTTTGLPTPQCSSAVRALLPGLRRVTGSNSKTEAAHGGTSRLSPLINMHRTLCGLRINWHSPLWRISRR